MKKYSVQWLMENRLKCFPDYETVYGKDPYSDTEDLSDVFVDDDDVVDVDDYMDDIMSKNIEAVCSLTESVREKPLFLLLNLATALRLGTDGECFPIVQERIVDIVNACIELKAWDRVDVMVSAMDACFRMYWSSRDGRYLKEHRSRFRLATYLYVAARPHTVRNVTATALLRKAIPKRPRYYLRDVKRDRDPHRTQILTALRACISIRQRCDGYIAAKKFETMLFGRAPLTAHQLADLRLKHYLANRDPEEFKSTIQFEPTLDALRDLKRCRHGL